jgi:Ser/Thr protein kinase RdoA (MazF antagonist)
VADLIGPELLPVLQERYGLRAPITARRLSGGYANDVFRVDSAGPPVVLHVKYPPADASSIEWEHRMLAALNEWLPEALAPMVAADGSTWFTYGDRPVWLVAHAAGEPAVPRDRRAVAAVLGRLHAAPIDVSPRPGHQRLLQLPLPEIGDYPADFTPLLPLLTRARQELTDLLVELEQRRPVTGLTHNDIFEGNVLIHEGQVSALIDWEEATLDWLAWDLASSVWPFCSDGDRLDLAAVGGFLEAYRGAGGPLPHEEEDLLVPLVQAKRLLEILRAPTDRHPNWDLQRANLRAYVALTA